MEARSPDLHPFSRHPHRTLVTLTIPVLLSLVVEPLTGIVDTAFIARLGPEELAGLGVPPNLNLPSEPGVAPGVDSIGGALWDAGVPIDRKIRRIGRRLYLLLAADLPVGQKAQTSLEE